MSRCENYTTAKWITSACTNITSGGNTLGCPYYPKIHTTQLYPHPWEIDRTEQIQSCKFVTLLLDGWLSVL